ncbi:lysozyme inhibitor LprI family protein [Enterobacter asburiae]|uniref:lysozyme inhibitor LprI family protein n=1 Tax=Scandinavium sp. UTDF21-P1B TaxID=3446379 RepID=UPI00347368D1
MKPIIIAAALLFSTAALADDCGNAGNQIDINTCAANQLKAADGRLNNAYGTAMKRAPQATKALLKTAQQKWIALRDADCALISSGTEGGSIQPMIHAQCLTDKTVERTAWLESLLNCEEGDLSCPLPPKP